MALDLNKTELRELIRDLIQKELGSNAFDKAVKSVISDEKIMNEKEIRDMVRQMLVNMHKLMWQRQDSWKRNI
jgi:hypothetical protein